MVRLWFRAEEKPHERRTIILPEHVQGYVDAGFNVTIERSSQRCVPDAEFEPLVDGTRVQLVAEGAWRDRQQPQKGKKAEEEEEEEVVVTGIKELFPEEYTAPLSDTFVQFGHAYKMQVGWKDFLGRFGDGGGTLLDLEYLVDDTGRRVAAYGHWAGYVGAGLGVLAWCTQVQTGCASILGAVDMTAYEAGKEVFIADIKAQLAAAQQVVEARGETFRPPAAVVIGALGRCGRGATELLRAVGLDGLGLWDMAETARGGPFPELLEYSIIVNCILLTSDVDKPFLVRDMLYQVDRRLSVIVDVACDPSAPHNPLPIYTEGTTFEAPALRLIDNVPGVHEAVDLIAIDHLPSLLPREASRTYCQQIVPHLLKLGKWRDDSVWHRAFAMFVRKSYAARGQSIVWLREETKPFERRAALTPQHAAILISRGVHVVVERMATRCFPDADYEAVGCQMATGGDWKVYAPLTAFILGIKELPAADTGPLEHDHIYFGHCYKQQAGWKDLLARFEAGGGRLHDLEFLMDDEGKRLAAFGFWAGWAGTALGEREADGRQARSRVHVQVRWPAGASQGRPRRGDGAAACGHHWCAGAVRLGCARDAARVWARERRDGAVGCGGDAQGRSVPGAGARL